MTKSQTPILQVRNLRTSFGEGRRAVHAVNGVSFDVQSGRVLCIVGESGSGKSVTVRSVMRLITSPGKITDGEALFHGEDMLQMSERKMEMLRGNKISMIFQNPLTSLNPAMTVGDQVGESLLLHRGMSPADAKAEVVSLLHQVGIPSPESRMSDYPAQFSGGMRQRIMIAAALCCKPEILIADEPTTALDVSMQAQILWLLAELQAEINNALIMITHDLGIVSTIADEVIVMYSGQVVEHASVEDIFARPRHPYTQGLIATVRALEDADLPLNPIPGTPTIPRGDQQGCSFAPRCLFATDYCRASKPELEMIDDGHKVACHIRPEGGLENG